MTSVYPFEPPPAFDADLGNPNLNQLTQIQTDSRLLPGNQYSLPVFCCVHSAVKRALPAVVLALPDGGSAMKSCEIVEPRGLPGAVIFSPTG